MNSSSDCHEIEDVPGLFVDAFKGVYLEKTLNHKNVFILTHYHGDHYQRLPKEFKYQGPAQIHCTPITAALLREVHEVHPQYVVEHTYGETWAVRGDAAKITFYDANHCPGAAIVLIELANGNIHLHCGDMRYSPTMKEYPLLKLAVEKRKMDLIYLDTTYGHPKHSFCPQEEAVDQIASVVETVSKETTTLILLSCYSIGKEKVLWECSRRAKQPIFVTERKHKMLHCCYSDKQDLERMCTLDPTKTDVHVIPMGLAGELWPYFQPNYPACRDYVEKLEYKQYTKVIAFLPTGWANGSNWNKKNAVVSQSVPFINKEGRVEIEIRLISYSEHSAFTELIDFVSFLKPRKIIPTVYRDAADRRKITNHFRNLMDSTRAKQKFFASMKKRSPSSQEYPPATLFATKRAKGSTKTCSMASKGTIKDEEYEESSNQTASQNSNSVVDEKPSKQSPSAQELLQLIAMGFSSTKAEEALNQSGGHLTAAVERLLSGDNGFEDGGADRPIVCDSPERGSPPTLKSTKSSSSITTMFSPRKSHHQ